MRPPHSISIGGLRTPAPVRAAPPSWGRHPQTFTKADLGARFPNVRFHLGSGHRKRVSDVMEPATRRWVSRSIHPRQRRRM